MIGTSHSGQSSIPRRMIFHGWSMRAARTDGELEWAELVRRQLRQVGDTDKTWTATLVCEVMGEIDRLLTDDPGRTLACRQGRRLALPL